MFDGPFFKFILSFFNNYIIIPFIYIYHVLGIEALLTNVRTDLKDLLLISMDDFFLERIHY